MRPQRAALCRMVMVTVDPHRNNGAEVAPAVICRAWSDTLVNLRVLYDGHEVGWLTSVPLFQTYAELEEARARHASAWRETYLSDDGVPRFDGAYWPPREIETTGLGESVQSFTPGITPSFVPGIEG